MIKKLINSQTKWYLLLGWFSLFLAFAENSFAATKKITVRVVAAKSVTSKMRVWAIGFSVNKKGRGSLGSDTTKTGPAGGKYSFGFKGPNGGANCGEATLGKDTTVVLHYKGKKCTYKLFFPKEKE